MAYGKKSAPKLKKLKFKLKFKIKKGK